MWSLWLIHLIEMLNSKILTWEALKISTYRLKKSSLAWFKYSRFIEQLFCQLYKFGELAYGNLNSILDSRLRWPSLLKLPRRIYQADRLVNDLNPENQGMKLKESNEIRSKE